MSYKISLSAASALSAASVFQSRIERGNLELNLVQLNSVSSAISTVRRTSMRFSLRDLLLFVAFAAAIAWCAAQVGFDNGLFWFVVGVLAILSGVFVHFARSERRRRALVLLIPVLALAFLIGSISVFVSSALLSLATLILAGLDRVTTRALWTISAVATVISLLAAVIPLRSYMQELEAARSAIPTVSLVSRLKYEKRPRADESPRELVTSAPVGSRLDDFEHTLELGAERKRQLLRLHTYQYRLFEGAVGFGLVRMIPLTPQSLHRPPLRDIGFAEVHVDWGDYFGAWRMAGRHTDQNAALPEYLHVLGRDDFLDPDGFGVAIEAPLKVTGFVEHAFHYPAFADLDARTSWTIKRLELVSLLKFDTPRVYVLDHLPRMDQLSSDDAPTRPLDAFETEALAKLWRDEDVVVKNDGDDYRMLGSLRAAKQCLECHSVQRGELLGAFTYSLRHEGPNKR